MDTLARPSLIGAFSRSTPGSLPCSLPSEAAAPQADWSLQYVPSPGRLHEILDLGSTRWGISTPFKFLTMHGPIR